MITLGIESSCDDTAIGILGPRKEVLVSLVSSQIHIHDIYGGVIPEVASREHLKHISSLFQEACLKAHIAPKDINVIAVTQGPGLIGALLVGIGFARGLALSLNKPLIPVNHVHAHVHGALLGLTPEDKIVYPALAIVVSGGHTNLYAMTDSVSFELLGSSIDDACGECFDKVAKLLGLRYPGGPKIEALALTGNPKAIPMPKMMASSQDLNFSYSGLKTHVYYRLKNEPMLHQADLAASFQEEAFMQICRKVAKIWKNYPTVLVSGGVSANQRFQAMLSDVVKKPSKVIFPLPTYCSDNGAMIASLGQDLYTSGWSGNREWDVFSR